jgi:cyclin B
MMFAVSLRGHQSSHSSGRREAFQDITNTEKKESSSTNSKLSLFSRKYIPKSSSLSQRISIDKNDALCKVDYVHEMYNYFSSRETCTSVRPLYMEDQNHLNELMRSILVDWLVDVCSTFHLTMATLFLTVNLIDRYLELSPDVSRKEFQLVGVAALWVASKYEEIRPMEIHQLIDICDSCYSKKQIFQKEKDIVHCLQFNLSIPTSLTFLLRFLKAANANRQMAHMAMYILESTLGSYSLLHYLPSQMAAASVYLARRTLVSNGWTRSLEEFTGYTKKDILPVAKAIWMESKGFKKETMKLTAVEKKYSSKNLSSVATMTLRGV